MFSKQFTDRLNYLKQVAADNHARRTDTTVAPTDGMTHAQSMRAQKARAEVAEQIKREVAELAGVPEKDHLQERRDKLAHDLKWASSETERRSLREALKMYDERLAERAAERAEQARIERFSDDPQVRNVRAFVETLRSAPQLYGAVDPTQIEVLKAIGLSTDFHDPGHLAKTFWAKLAEIEEAQYAHDDAKRREQIELASAKLGELNEAQDRASASAARLAEAKAKMEGGENGSQPSDA
jgi:hypothetical protein